MPIKRYDRNFKVTTMFRMLEVKCRGFYAWQSRPKSNCQHQNEKLLEKIEELFGKYANKLYLYLWSTKMYGASLACHLVLRN